MLSFVLNLNLAAADDGGPRDPKAFDKLVVDTLRDVHNKGADLYNTSKDYAGTFRIYEGSLRTMRPLLAHRPEAQKFIDDGLAASDKEADVARRAFLLHETIEKVRAYLKTGSSVTPTPKVEPKPVPVPVPTPKVEPKPVPVPMPMPKVEPKPVPVPMPTPKVEPKPTPKPPAINPPSRSEPKPPTKSQPPTVKEQSGAIKTPDAAIPMGQSPMPRASGLGMTGKVTLAGKPAGDVDLIFVSLDLPLPRTFSAKTKDDGSFSIAGSVLPSKYVVVATGKDVPAKYVTTTTSGVVVDVKPGSVNEIVLK